MPYVNIVFVVPLTGRRTKTRGKRSQKARTGTGLAGIGKSWMLTGRAEPRTAKGELTEDRKRKGSGTGKVRRTASASDAEAAGPGAGNASCASATEAETG